MKEMTGHDRGVAVIQPVISTEPAAPCTQSGETGQPRFTVLQTPLYQVRGHSTHSSTPSLQLGPWTQGLKGRVTRSLPRGPATPSSLGSTFGESLREAQFLR